MLTLCYASPTRLNNLHNLVTVTNVLQTSLSLSLSLSVSLLEQVLSLSRLTAVIAYWSQRLMLGDMNVKAKAYIYSPDIPICTTDLTSITPRYCNSFTVSSPLAEYSAFSAAEAIHTVSIFILLGTHHCWVDRDGVDLKLAHGFYTWQVLWESNLRPLDHCSNTSTTGP